MKTETKWVTNVIALLWLKYLNNHQFLPPRVLVKILENKNLSLCMLRISSLPSRQLILLSTTFVAGILLIVCSVFNLVERDTLSQLIFYYGMCVPIFLLVLETVIDLSDKKVFTIWMTIAVVFLLLSLKNFFIYRYISLQNTSANPDEGSDNFYYRYSSSSLKTLFIFLICYWLLNKLLKRKGLFLINTFWKTTWYNDAAQRKITWLDVAINIILFFVIIGSAFIRW